MIKLTDVTLRDGLQSDPHQITTEQKLNLFYAVESCGFSRIEITSFSHPKWIPQLADSDSLCEKIFQGQPSFASELMAFVPNERGLERLLKYPIQWVSGFIGASETFNQKNINASRLETLENLKKIIGRAKTQKRKCRIYISTVFGCPYEGEIAEGNLIQLIQEVVDLEPDEIALSDTIGVASPGKVKAVIEKVSSFFPKGKIALHLHNTYGLALANVEAGLNAGVTQFDGATGGIGGCPYAKGASGNVATEEIAYFLERSLHPLNVSWSSIQKTIQLLDQWGLHLESKLAAVIKKGGSLYGISKSHS